MVVQHVLTEDHAIGVRVQTAVQKIVQENMQVWVRQTLDGTDTIRDKHKVPW